MLQITKPYYQLNINSFCTTEVYVNDVLVDEGSQAMQFKSPDIDKQSNIELEIKLYKRTKQKGFSII